VGRADSVCRTFGVATWAPRWGGRAIREAGKQPGRGQADVHTKSSAV
jgi:hypothetical protein